MKLKKHVVIGISAAFLLLSTASFAETATNTAANSSTDAVAGPPTPQIQNGMLTQDVQRFVTALQIVKKYYVDPVTDDKLFNNAIRGVLNGLDPHSSFLDAQDMQDLKDMTTGQFSGLGIELTPVNGYLKVITPLDDSPAQKVGIKSGDYIVRINDTFVKDMTLPDAVKRMRGTKGSVVYLTIVRSDLPKPLRLKLVRDDIHVKSVKGRLLEDRYGYVRIASFQMGTESEVRQAIKALQAQAQPQGGLKGIIIDLRNNPGGLLDSAVAVSDDFLDVKTLGNNKLIVYTKGRLPDSDIKIMAKSSGIVNNLPIVVLINEGSASGAEIVAGALQDHRRAVLVGTNSFGKGSVQTVIPLDETTALKLTTALYYTPLGRSIQASGIHPDVVVPDIKIPASAIPEDVPDFVKEADLKGHLANGNASSSADKAAVETTTSLPVKPEPTSAKELATTDNQLFAALSVVEGLAAVQSSK